MEDVNATNTEVTAGQDVQVNEVSSGTDSLLTSMSPEETPAATEDNNTLLTQNEDGATDGEPAEAVIPDEYDIKTIDGYEINKEMMDELTPLFKELKISAVGAQKLADYHMQIMQKQSAAASEMRKQMIGQWSESIKKDPQFGGAMFNENMALARRGLKAVMPADANSAKELTMLLNDSGMGNHPEIIKVFAKVGKMIKEDSVMSGRAGSTVVTDPIARLFSKSLGLDIE